MSVRPLRAFARTVAWNLAAVGATAFCCSVAMFGGDPAFVALGTVFGLMLGAGAGVVHAVVALPLTAAWPRAVVLLSPLLAGWAYDDASTAAAESAARRNGASTASRNDGSAPDISRATSE